MFVYGNNYCTRDGMLRKKHAIKDGLTLADRSWTCGACNTTHNRDYNAAINIRNVGLLGLYPA